MANAPMGIKRQNMTAQKTNGEGLRSEPNVDLEFAGMSFRSLYRSSSNVNDYPRFSTNVEHFGKSGRLTPNGTMAKSFKSLPLA